VAEEMVNPSTNFTHVREAESFTEEVAVNIAVLLPKMR
jgi:hypothetical protein